MRKYIIFFSVLTVLFCVSKSFAGLCTVGEPIEIGSWAQRFNESGVGYFDFIAIKMVSADTFMSPPFSSFNNASWSVEYQQPMLGTATGNAVTSLDFNIGFTGAKSDPFMFYFAAFSGDTLLETARVTWNGSGWNIVSINWDITRADLVPAPTAVILGVLGLGVAGIKLRKYA